MDLRKISFHGLIKFILDYIYNHNIISHFSKRSFENCNAAMYFRLVLISNTNKVQNFACGSKRIRYKSHMRNYIPMGLLSRTAKKVKALKDVHHHYKKKDILCLFFNVVLFKRSKIMFLCRLLYKRHISKAMTMLGPNPVTKFTLGSILTQ